MISPLCAHIRADRIQESVFVDPKGAAMSTADTIERPYSEDDVERLRGSVTSSTRSHGSARSGCASCSPRTSGPRARRDDRRPGGADGEGRPAGDLPLGLAGRGRREPLRQHLPRPEPLPGEQRPRPRAPDQQRPPARRPDRPRRGRRLGPLAGADRRRRRGRLRRAAERLRDHEVVHRGRRRRRALRGSALVREEVRPPRRQGARPDEPARPHARRGTARGRRRRSADARRRPHGRALGDASSRATSTRRTPRSAPASARPRASSGSATASTRRSPAASPTRRTPTCSGARPPPPTWPRRSGSPPRSTSATPASSSPTTARRRSTGAST